MLKKQGVNDASAENLLHVLVLTCSPIISPFVTMATGCVRPHPPLSIVLK